MEVLGMTLPQRPARLPRLRLQQIAVTLTEGVAHLRNDRRRSPIRGLAVPEAERVEHPAEQAWETQQADAQPTAVDTALDDAAAGRSTAESLAASLRAIPYTPAREDRSSWSWRWLIPAALLLVAAILISAAGMAMDVDEDSPFLFPATPPAPPPTRPVAAATTTTTPQPVEQEPLEFAAQVHDPFGDGVERDRDLPLLADNDVDTAWRTESYSSPLTAIKPGVGLVFTIEGSPTRFEMVASSDAGFRIGWAPELPESFDTWDFSASGTTTAGVTLVPLPERANGVWLLWFTDLPEQSNGKRFAAIAEIRFLS